MKIALRSIKQLYGNKLGASDGEIGRVKDFYFDDQSWAIRYVIADTGSWLAERAVLISPHAFGRLRQFENVLRLKLTRKQIEDSPSIDTHKPVSRQYEEAYHSYYGWPYYWQGNALWGMSSVPMAKLPPRPEPDNASAAPTAQPNSSSAHLRSTLAVNGYNLQASDGPIGHICDFMMDSQSWAIKELVIKTGHRFSGKEVRIPTGKVSRISYDESMVVVDMTKEAVEEADTGESVPAQVDA